MTRINRAIAQLERDQPIFYTGGHAGAELTVEAGRAMQTTWADYINVGMEHGTFDVAGLEAFMRGLSEAAGDTPAVLVELPATGTSREAMAANALEVVALALELVLPRPFERRQLRIDAAHVERG